MPRIGQSTETESTLVVARGWKGLERNEEWQLTGMGVLLGWWYCSKIDYDDGCTTLNFIL